MDFDSHAKRFDNRIIRSSTRLATYEGNEKSDFYKDKILTLEEALKILDINIPDEFQYDETKYVKSANGYIVDKFANDKDVKRGLYPLAIPSNFIFRCNLTEFAHVYKERNINGSANPEVKECVEKCMDLIEEQYSQFNRDLMFAIRN